MVFDCWVGCFMKSILGCMFFNFTCMSQLHKLFSPSNCNLSYSQAEFVSSLLLKMIW
uniref:Uncharacterized protein n=1 Tax=Rhizophora mucronata TaxID=61149 RepID=A0A2P2J2U0_RHIMU